MTKEIDALIQSMPGQLAGNKAEWEKYLSLVSTLKGHEEFTLNEKGIIISSNLEAVNITGYEEYEVIGKHLSIFYTKDEIWKAHEDLIKAETFGRIVVSGIRLKKRGITFWAKMKIKHFENECAHKMFKVTLQDNTHRTLSKIRVQSLRDEFLTIFNNPFIGTFKYLKSDSRVLLCNKKTLEIVGCKESDSAKLLFSNFFSSQSQWSQFNSLLDQEERVEGFQFLINDKRNDIDNWGLISARYFERQGYVGGVLMDVSEQFQNLSELQRVNSELERFSYHASHDLRAPLTTILGLANLGVKTESMEEAHSYFQMIQQRIHHLDTLLKDLVSISYNAKGEVKSEHFDFKNEIELLIDSLHGSYPHVNTKCEVMQPHHFANDPTRLRTILRNLISNSLKYHNPENTPSYMSLKIKVGLTHASIKLQDNGIGIERTYKEKIFDMFFRATTHSSGSGLGLYIVKSMLEKIGGKIAVESTVFQGSTFLLTIPNRNFNPSAN